MLQNEHATNFFCFNLKPNIFCTFVCLCYHLTVWTKVQEINVYVGIWRSLTKVSMLHVIRLTFGMRSNTWFFVSKCNKNIAFHLMEDMLFFCLVFLFFVFIWDFLLFNSKFISFRNFTLKFRGAKNAICDAISWKMRWLFSMSNIALISGTFFNFKSQSLRIHNVPLIYQQRSLSFHIKWFSFFFFKSICSANFNHHWIWFMSTFFVICRTNHWM